MIYAKWEGMDELRAAVAKMAAAVSPDAAEPLFLQGATVVAEDARSRARQGPTGNLKRSLTAGLLKRLGNNPATAIAAVKLNIAPYAHIIEFGSSRAPAYPFFRPAVDAKAESVARNIESGLARLVEGAIR